MTLLRRLFLALFLIGLALPSVAVPVQAESALPSCHAATPAEAPHHQPDADEGKATGHACIGCVVNGTAIVTITPMPIPALLPPLQPMAALAGANAPPSIPPPRS